MSIVIAIREALVNRNDLFRTDKAITTYALELIDDYISRFGTETPAPTEERMLKGAAHWRQYSRCGFSLVSMHDIAVRFYGEERAAAMIELHGDRLYDFQGDYLESACDRILTIAYQLTHANTETETTETEEREEETMKSEEIRKNSEEAIICAECGCVIDEDHVTYVHGGDPVCEDCLEENYEFCEECGEWYPKEDVTWVSSAEVCICDDCLRTSRRFTRCEHCGEIIPSEDSITVTSRYGIREDWCQSCVEDDAFYCEDCETYLNDRWHTSNIYRDLILCDDCYETRREEEDDEDEESEQDFGDIRLWRARRGVQSYGFKPVPCPCCTERERGTAVESETFRPLVPLLGFEDEMEDGRNNGDNLDSDADYLNDALGFTYVKHDGSLTDGMELVSHPATLAYYMEKKETFREAFDEMIHRGYTSHDNRHCGLHVHISKAPLLEANEFAVHNMLIIFDNLWDKLVRFSRRTESQLDSWAKRYSTKYDAPKEVVKKAKGCGRYMAVNLENEHTVEIRIFRGTLKVDTFIATLQLVQRLIDVSIEITDPNEARNVTWERLVGSEYKELNEYCAKRFADVFVDPSDVPVEEEPQVQEEPQESDEPAPHLSGLAVDDFREGDYVRMCADSIHCQMPYGFSSSIRPGWTGIVRTLDGYDRIPVGVEFDQGFRGHNLGGVINNTRGQWLPPMALEIVIPALRVGDHVRVHYTSGAQNFYGPQEGTVGIVRSTEHGVIAVEFGEDFVGHVCNGTLPGGHGYYMTNRDLVRVN